MGANQSGLNKTGRISELSAELVKTRVFTVDLF